jgi:predicted dehydrogenase
MKITHPIVFSSLVFMIAIRGISQDPPLRIGVAGLTHTHVHQIFNSAKEGAIEIVGIAESNSDLAQRYIDLYGFDMERVYPTLDDLINAQNPEAVAAFGTIYDHLSLVETCAPRGIHVMVEKPLAVSMEHALKIKALALDHRIQVLTNYETTWYPTTQKAFELVQDSTVGAVRKVIIRDGHRGPAKIGVDPEFLEWLIDPVRNGGGALMDFGCYGANLMTHLMDGEKPSAVTAITQQFQPESNPKVEDEALILLEYPNTNAVIHASWNWPIGRKDMEIYGLKGALYADNRSQVRLRMAEGYDGFQETVFELESRQDPYHDPFSYFRAVIRGKIAPEPFDLSSLENNLVVIEILEAAKQSAREGKRVVLSKN